MDKQQLLVYFQDHYLSRQDVLYKLPLNISIDSFWQDLVNQRKARYNASAVLRNGPALLVRHDGQDGQSI